MSDILTVPAVESASYTLGDLIRDPIGMLRDLIGIIARGQIEYLKKPLPHDADARTAAVGMHLARQETWQRMLATIEDDLARDLQGAGKPAKEVHELLQAVQQPLKKIMCANVRHPFLNAVACRPGEETADAAAEEAEIRETVESSREAMADAVIDPLRNEALRAVDVLATAWRPLSRPGRRCSRLPARCWPTPI
jgi:hypothetical protein